MQSKLNLFILSLFYFVPVFNAQASNQKDDVVQHHIDSLYKSLSKSKHDTDIVRNYLYLAEAYIVRDLDSSIIYSKKAIELTEKLMKNIPNNKEIKQFVNLRLANGYTSLGSAIDEKGNVELALEKYKKALHYARLSNDNGVLGLIINNLASIHYNMKDYTTAMNYLKESYALCLVSKDKENLPLYLLNIGSVYKEIGQIDSALLYSNKGLDLYSTYNNSYGVASSKNIIALIYLEQKKEELALSNFSEALQIAKENNYETIALMVQNNLGFIYYKRNENEIAKKYLQEVQSKALEFGNLNIYIKATGTLYKIYKKEGDFKNALLMFEENRKYQDSLSSSEVKESLMKQKMELEFEKQKLIDQKENEKQLAVSEQVANRQRIVSGGIGFILLLVLIFSVFIYKRLQLTAKQKTVIEEQKLIVDIKNKEIIESINYAKRIQLALLPPVELIAEKFPESFVMYAPKDIVAGDFYWFYEDEQHYYIAVCDCTGHGVPGALVSVVCFEALNKAMLDLNNKSTGAILTQTRNIVIGHFEKSGEEVKDGMDASLLRISKHSNKVQWSGANNPLWLINSNRTNWPDTALSLGENYSAMYIKPNKEAVGKSDKMDPFVTHEFEYEANDMFYLFTDGFADQFGGDYGKKLQRARFKDLIVNASELSFAAQKAFLESEFTTWKGGLEQVDDVCVIGIKLS